MIDLYSLLFINEEYVGEGGGGYEGSPAIEKGSPGKVGKREGDANSG